MELCVQASGSIPESYSIDFSVFSSVDTAQSESGKTLIIIAGTYVHSTDNSITIYLIILYTIIL